VCLLAYLGIACPEIKVYFFGKTDVLCFRLLGYLEAFALLFFFLKGLLLTSQAFSLLAFCVSVIVFLL
jgi:hypothetical protein